MANRSARIYGAPQEDRPTPGIKYSDRRKGPEPKPKEPDPSPPADLVEKFHKNSDLDKSRESQHNTIGLQPYQAASGAHRHQGGDSVPLFEGITLSGSKGGNVALGNLITILTQFGLKDNTT